MFYQEPGLQLSGADNLANDQVIAPIVAELRDFRGGIVPVDQDRLMRFKQPGEHRWNFFAAVRSTADFGELGDVPRVADRNASEGLHAFRDRARARPENRGRYRIPGSRCILFDSPFEEINSAAHSLWRSAPLATMMAVNLGTGRHRR